MTYIVKSPSTLKFFQGSSSPSRYLYIEHVVGSKFEPEFPFLSIIVTLISSSELISFPSLSRTLILIIPPLAPEDSSIYTSIYVSLGKRIPEIVLNFIIKNMHIIATIIN